MVRKFLSLDGIEDPVLQKDKMVPLFRVDRGGIVGIEAINKDSNYLTNVEAIKDFTVLYKIKLNNLKECSISIAQYLQSMLNEQTELINKMVDQEIEKMKKKKSRNIDKRLLMINNDYVASNKRSFSNTNMICEFAKTIITSDRKKPPKINKKKKLKIVFDFSKLQRDYQLFTSRNTKNSISNEPDKKLSNCALTERKFETMSPHKLTLKKNISQINIRNPKKSKRVKNQSSFSSTNEEMRIVSILKSFSKPKKSRTSQQLCTIYNTGYFNLPLISST